MTTNSMPKINENLISTEDEVNEDSKSDQHISKKPLNSAYDIQKMRLDRLMNRIDKPIVIPEPSKERKLREPHEFIRNIWGSSAGVGSGDFHIYRGIRRRENARLAHMDGKEKEEILNDEFEMKREELLKQADEVTAKKRLKRLKKKAKKGKSQNKTQKKSGSNGQIHDSGSDEQSSEEMADSTAH